MTIHNNSKSILAIDDEYDIVNLMQSYLQMYGFKCITFTNSLEALEHFASNPNDCTIFISDIRIPSMNGYELVKQVKEINPLVTIIFMNALKKQTEFSNVLSDLKINAFIQKPFSLSTLKTLQEKVLAD